jgi:hypothetical protein
VFTPEILGENALSSTPETCHDLRMSKSRQLRDAYRQAGFVPQATLRDVDFDPFAFGVSLVRRRKKRSAECAAGAIGASTISDRIGRAISIALSVACSSSSSFEGFSVGVVGP